MGASRLTCAYAGRLDDAAPTTPTAAARPTPPAGPVHHYAAGEIEKAAGNWAEAQRHYEECIRLSEQSGATFLHGVAAVGLATAQASAGELDKALVGYAELIGRFERTGAWVQQWTTLRNLADLLDRLHDQKTATALRAAAEAAADASAPQPVTAQDTRPDRKSPAAAVSREQVLRDGARRHRAPPQGHSPGSQQVTTTRVGLLLEVRRGAAARVSNAAKRLLRGSGTAVNGRAESVPFWRLRWTIHFVEPDFNLV